MELIVLTEIGEKLCLPPGIVREDGDKIFNGTPYIGTHWLCGGHLEIRESSETHNVIFCTYCHLRITPLKCVQTYGDLRKWCGLMISSAAEKQRYADQVCKLIDEQTPCAPINELVRKENNSLESERFAECIEQITRELKEDCD